MVRPISLKLVAAAILLTLPACLTGGPQTRAAGGHLEELLESAERLNLQGLYSRSEPLYREALVIVATNHDGPATLHDVQARLAGSLVMQEKIAAAQPLLEGLLKIPAGEFLSNSGDDEMYYLTALADAYRAIGLHLQGPPRLTCMENCLALRNLVVGRRGNLSGPVSELVIARILAEQYDKAASLNVRLREEISHCKDGSSRNAILLFRIALAYKTKGKASQAAPFEQESEILFKKSASQSMLALVKEREAVRFFLDWRMLPEAEEHAHIAFNLVKPPMPPIFETDLLGRVYIAEGKFGKGCDAYKSFLSKVDQMEPAAGMAYIRNYSLCLKKMHQDKEAAILDARCSERAARDLKKH